MKKFAYLLVATIALAPLLEASAERRVGIENAKGERLASAKGHYLRSRAHLVEALREFDRARELADPDAMLDAGIWRNTVLSRVDELERLLDPQPRLSESGVRFQADSRLLNETEADQRLTRSKQSSESDSSTKEEIEK